MFERQWVLRDFKKTVGMAVDTAKDDMRRLLSELERGGAAVFSNYSTLLLKLKKYYERQHKLLQGYEKDPKKLKENSEIILSWISDIDTALSLMQ